MTKWEEVLVAGEIVEGEAAHSMLEMHEQHAWKLWVKIAVAYMKKGKVEMAQDILEKLLEGEVE